MKPYLPDKLPLESLDWERLVSLIGAGREALARYDGVLSTIPNPAVLLSPLTTQEAVISSRIEGTVTSLEEVLEIEADGEEAVKKDDEIWEVVNYRMALVSAARMLVDRPVSLHMIRTVHEILLNSVRGQEMGRGSFRRDQNWIGRPGSTIEEATYVPPEPQMVPEYMENLEAYFTHPEKDPLVQQAIIHAQFELIHPFKDGNGRVGRMLIPLLLYKAGLLAAPMFYLSEYLEAHRDQYFDHLLDISRQGRWQQWVEFFLKAVTKQAKENTAKAREILRLYNWAKAKVPELTRSQFAIRALDEIFAKPTFTASGFTRRSGIPKHSAGRIIRELVDGEVIGVLKPGRGRRPTTYYFGRLLLAAEGKTVV